MNQYLLEDISYYLTRYKYNYLLKEYNDRVRVPVSYLPNAIYSGYMRPNSIRHFYTNNGWVKLQINTKYYQIYGIRFVSKFKCPPFSSINTHNVNHVSADGHRRSVAMLPRNYEVTYPTKEDLLKILPENWRFGNYNFMGKLKNVYDYYGKKEKYESISHGGCIETYC